MSRRSMGVRVASACRKGTSMNHDAVHPGQPQDLMCCTSGLSVVGRFIGMVGRQVRGTGSIPNRVVPRAE